jgi:hypothetical protein
MRILLATILGSLTAINYSSAAAEPPPPAEQTTQPATDWPKVLLGRKLQHTSDNFVIYANISSSGVQLASIVEQELQDFQSRYDLQVPGPGIILAIEPGDDPSRALELWRKAHAASERDLKWSHPKYRNPFNFEHRPYCSFESYFRESFYLPVVDLRELAADELSPALEIAWCCVLTTNAHVRATLNSLLVKSWRETSAKKWRKMAPSILENLSAVPFFLLIGTAGYAKNLVLDLNMLKLQRRETLWITFLKVSLPDNDARTKLLEQLESEIDDQWRQLWLKRPIT